MLLDAVELGDELLELDEELLEDDELLEEAFDADGEEGGDEAEGMLDGGCGCDELVLQAVKNPALKAQKAITVTALKLFIIHLFVCMPPAGIAFNVAVLLRTLNDWAI